MKPIVLFTTIAALGLVSCKPSRTEVVSETTPPAIDPALEAILLEQAPDGAVSIVEARANPAPGTEVVFAGKIMGRAKPFVEGRAMVVLGDPARITSCDLKPGDNCATPWDTCCDLKEDISKSIVTVQVVDEEGRLLAHGLKGLGGMKELSSVVVQGTVAEGSNENNFLVNATGIHVAMVEPTKDNPAADNAE